MQSWDILRLFCVWTFFFFQALLNFLQYCFCFYFIFVFITMFCFLWANIYYYYYYLFLAVLGLCCFPLVAVNGEYSLLWCLGFSLYWLLLWQSTDSGVHRLQQLRSGIVRSCFQSICTLASYEQPQTTEDAQWALLMEG